MFGQKILFDQKSDSSEKRREVCGKRSREKDPHTRHCDLRGVQEDQVKRVWYAQVLGSVERLCLCLFNVIIPWVNTLQALHFTVSRGESI